MSDFLLIQPRPENLGGQPILRPLPSAKCRSVGPFVFFDHILENTYPAGSGMNINQHPHIGLSTLTYLFEGQLQHKDSLGSNQLVSPGEVSWMTAGHAVAHVERTPQTLWESGSHMHGLQVWLAMPARRTQLQPSSREQLAAQYQHGRRHLPDCRQRLLPAITRTGTFPNGVCRDQAGCWRRTANSRRTCRTRAVLD
jgi:redox-sensitive bicupin YhaK (pirin superfamily)